MKLEFIEEDTINQLMNETAEAIGLPKSLATPSEIVRLNIE